MLLNELVWGLRRLEQCLSMNQHNMGLSFMDRKRTVATTIEVCRTARWRSTNLEKLPDPVPYTPEPQTQTRAIKP